MAEKRIIMSYSTPPSPDDLAVMAEEILEGMPADLAESAEDLLLQVEEFPDGALEHDLDLEDPYELLAFYKSGTEISPGVERKDAKEEDVLILFRRPILDLWCERGEELNDLLREVMIEEIGKKFDFSEDEIEDMTEQLSRVAF